MPTVLSLLCTDRAGQLFFYCSEPARDVNRNAIWTEKSVFGLGQGEPKRFHTDSMKQRQLIWINVSDVLHI